MCQDQDEIEILTKPNQKIQYFLFGSFLVPVKKAIEHVEI